MHVHLPKPLHGWREFFGEIGIIVLGVLIALGAEQLIESLHAAGQRREARAAIEGELQQNLDGFRRRAEVQRCIDTRLDDMQRLLVTTPLGDALPRPLWVGRPQIWVVVTNVWEAITAGARTALLSLEQQQAYSQIYGLQKAFDQAQEREQEAWARLRVLEDMPKLDAQARLRMLEALHQARYANFRILVAAAQTRDLASSMGLRPQPTRYGQGTISACIPMNASREEALSRIFEDRAIRFEP